MGKRPKIIGKGIYSFGYEPDTRGNPIAKLISPVKIENKGCDYGDEIEIQNKQLGDQISQRNLYSIEIFSEKIIGKGEDAKPILNISNDKGTMAVFDGMGGAGAGSYVIDGKTRTNASLASELVRDVTNTMIEENHQELIVPLELKQKILNKFRWFTNLHGTGTSSLRGTIIKQLPTTMALISYTSEIVQSEIVLNCNVLWAGDSRCYLLDKINGLAQITIDDLVSNADPLINLQEDSPLSNYINESSYFELHQEKFSVRTPIIIITSTDGAFNYLPTPMHFEHMLLKSLIFSNSEAEWKKELEKEILSIAADDVSLTILAIGWTKFESLKQDLSHRYSLVDRKYFQPLNNLMENKQAKSITNELYVEEVNKLWGQYSKVYLQRDFLGDMRGDNH